MFPFFLLLAAATAPMPEQALSPPAEMASSDPSSRSFLAIDPKSRAADYIQAFEWLRKEKPTLKISIRTAKGLLLSNVSDLSTSANGTLMLVKLLSNQGTKLMILPLEDIAEISYSS